MTNTVKQTSVETKQDDETRSFWTLTRVVTLAAVGLAGFITLLFVIGLVLALIDPVGVPAFFAYVKNLLLIALTMQGILIIAGIGILIVQIARFVNLLSSEVKPIVSDTKQAMQNVKATTAFVSKETVEPVVKTKSFLAGLTTFVVELLKIRRLVKRDKK